MPVLEKHDLSVNKTFKKISLQFVKHPSAEISTNYMLLRLQFLDILHVVWP